MLHLNSLLFRCFFFRFASQEFVCIQDSPEQRKQDKDVCLITRISEYFVYTGLLIMVSVVLKYCFKAEILLLPTPTVSGEVTDVILEPLHNIIKLTLFVEDMSRNGNP